MSNEKKVETAVDLLPDNDMAQVVNALSARVSVLEKGYAEFAEFVNSFSSVDAEEEFMEERQRWIDTCRDEAAEKRRTS